DRSMQRRTFINQTLATTAALRAFSNPAVHSQEPAKEDPKPVILGVMGYSRGRDLAEELIKIPGVIIKYICETDRQRGESGVRRIAEVGGKAELVSDLRRVLDDPTVDAFVCAAPNHWHGPATILGCKAGKHIYVEKPASHNPQEGEWMVQAANRYQRCVQVGNQRRSSAGYQAAIAKLHSGAIGKVYLGRTFFSRIRGPIGTEVDSVPPDYLDYEMWQGPAPRRPYRKNVVHYNWHWFWNWGNGELGNNGPHGLDICRWGLQVDYPTRTVSSGGRYRYSDDQETPDTHSVSWEFEGGKQIEYQGLSHTKHTNGPFVSFYGYDGYMEIDSDGGYQIFDTDNKLVDSAPKTDWGQKDHVGNFIEAVRANDPSRLRQPILSGHQSTLLCHLGNIAHRTQRVIHSDPTSGRILDSDVPQGLWRREYDPKWEKLISEI
ncbi:MAG: Gfo/Idh/MocA family protein, partial [Planctomycetota bacterium]